MKLWVKLTCISLTSALVAVAVCLYIFSAWQTERIISDAEQRAMSSLSLFCTNLNTIDKNSFDDQMSQSMRRSIVEYYFAEYSHMMDGSASYSLIIDSEYLYNTCPYDPAARLSFTDNMENARKTTVIDGKYYVMAAKHIYLIGELYSVYICMDVTEAYDHAGEITLVSAALMTISALLAVTASTLLVRTALRPMNELRNTAERIADGEYSLRASFTSEDEVAALAISFNHMADAVESRIDELTEQSERRKLLLGALAHELKTPMTAVIGFADSLLKMPVTEENTLSCAVQILTAGQRTERISQKLMLLLSLDKSYTVESRQFEWSTFADELRQSYDLRVNITAQGTATGDRDLLYSLVQNLINNALHAGESDSTVNVTLNDNCISVSDNGRGIPPEHLARLTEPFYRVDKARSRAHGGVGLGLSLCKAIAEAHGGHLAIQSELHKGTTVTVALHSEGK